MHNIFKVLGDENRYRVFTYLVKKGESCVCDLEKLLDIKQANLSKHLGVMKKSNILSTRPVGKYVHYRISDEFKSEYKLLVKLIDTKVENVEMECNCK